MKPDVESGFGVWRGSVHFLVHSLKAVLIAGPSGFHTCFSVSAQELTHINSCESPSNQTGLIVWIIPCAFVSLAPLAVASALCRLELKTEFLCSLLAVRSVLMLVGFGCCFLFLFLFLVFRYSVPFDNMLLGKSYLGTIFLIGLYFALT